MHPILQYATYYRDHEILGGRKPTHIRLTYEQWSSVVTDLEDSGLLIKDPVFRFRRELLGMRVDLV